MAFLRIVRPVNLLLLLFTQVAIKYGFFEPLGIDVAMGHIDFGFLVVATLCIAAAGNVINDIHDVAIDTINKPGRVILGTKISEKKAYNFYLVLNVLGVGAGFLVANRLGHPGLAAIFIGISILLYSYASYLSTIVVLSNLVISILVACSLLVLIIFDIYPVIIENPTALQITAATTIVWFAASAFYLNLLREIVKDIQDVNGDKNGGRNTLAIVLGRSRTTTIVFGLGLIALFALLWFTNTYLYNFKTVNSYFIFLIGAPLLYFCIRAWNAKRAKDYMVLSWILKLVMFTGVCSLLFFAEILTL
ncbi:UbiA family prenyltransferase [Rasiella rasia]|uniref:UbiA family prenyltransferase n=1 Tax=Rasiella rasia TaxID=2744027 RepID=A0A6G6GMN7_9FLAO|nr:geranylgeranylglycerol-phosphate geranylgeranyltransferase [Rasiella rasia]QIE58961.1 UbiA family prenyltransferase [Rasiella rasia]